MMKELPPELVEQAVWHLQAGDQIETSFRTLMRAYRELVLNSFRNRGLSSWDAEDLAQECFLAAAVSIDRFHWQAPFRSWLLGIATNLYRAWVRQKVAQRRWGSSVPLTALATSQPSPHSIDPEPLGAAIRRQRHRQLVRAISSLPAQMSRCTRLYYLDQHNTRQIAERLGLKTATVRVQLHRARHLLAERLRVGNVLVEEDNQSLGRPRSAR
nr:ECF RNA polymerase sigma factor SigW-like [Nerophis lumbriciformis]